MSLVYLRNKETAITYVYENQAFWDKEKQQSRSKRKLIGKLDPETGEVIPTRAYRKHAISALQSMIPKPGPVPITQTHRSFYGASYLLDQIGKITGVEADLKACFPDTYQRILSMSNRRCKKQSCLNLGHCKVFWMNWIRLSYWKPQDTDVSWERSPRNRSTCIKHWG
ncbi:MAG: hypothetical protein PHD83_00080 [Caldisericia bacterium]|nr:hypothetical protein [Caldisericia bacterium]